MLLRTQHTEYEKSSSITSVNSTSCLVEIGCARSRESTSDFCVKLSTSILTEDVSKFLAKVSSHCFKLESNSII